MLASVTLFAVAFAAAAAFRQLEANRWTANGLIIMSLALVVPAALSGAVISLISGGRRGLKVGAGLWAAGMMLLLIGSLGSRPRPPGG